MFEQIADLAETTFESAVVYANMLRGVASNLRSLARLGADSPVSADREQQKRDAIAHWLKCADQIDIASDMIERGPVDGEVLAQEIFDALAIRSYNFLGADKGAEIDILLRERANNIAQAYQGRVAMEPK